MDEFLDQLVCIPCLWSYEKIDNIFNEFKKELSIWNVMVEFYDPKTPGYELPNLTREDFKKIRLGLKSTELNHTIDEEQSIQNIMYIDVRYFTEFGAGYNYTADECTGEHLNAADNPRCEFTIHILSKSPQYYNQLQQSGYGRELIDLLKLTISANIQDKLNELVPKGFEMRNKGVYNFNFDRLTD